MSTLVENPIDRFSRDEAHIISLVSQSYVSLIEPHHEKTSLRGLHPGKTQTGLLSYRDKLEV